MDGLEKMSGQWMNKRGMLGWWSSWMERRLGGATDWGIATYLRIYWVDYSSCLPPDSEMTWGICGSLLDDEERAASRDEVSAVCMSYPVILSFCDKTRSLDRIFDRYNVELVFVYWIWCWRMSRDFGLQLDGYYDQHCYCPQYRIKEVSVVQLSTTSISYTSISANLSAPLSSRSRSDRVVN